MHKSPAAIYSESGNWYMTDQAGNTVLIYPQSGGGGGISVTGTGFVTATANVIDGAATANIRYAGGKFQTDVDVQWKNASITGNLQWTPTTSNKSIILPDASGQVVLRDSVDTLTNKTIQSDANTLTSSGQGVGDILVNNGSKYVRLARGTALQVLRVNGTANGLEWATPSSGGSGLPGGASNGQLLGWESGAAAWTNHATYIACGSTYATAGDVRLGIGGAIKFLNTAGNANLTGMYSTGSALNIGSAAGTEAFPQTSIWAGTEVDLVVGGATAVAVQSAGVQIFSNLKVGTGALPTVGSIRLAGTGSIYASGGTANPIGVAMISGGPTSIDVATPSIPSTINGSIITFVNAGGIQAQFTGGVLSLHAFLGGYNTGGLGLLTATIDMAHGNRTQSGSGEANAPLLYLLNTNGTVSPPTLTLTAGNFWIITNGGSGNCYIQSTSNVLAPGETAVFVNNGGVRKCT